MAKEYREKVERELREICHDVLELLDKFLIPKAGNAESKVFYLKVSEFDTRKKCGQKRRKIAI